MTTKQSIVVCFMICLAFVGCDLGKERTEFKRSLVELQSAMSGGLPRDEFRQKLIKIETEFRLLETSNPNLITAYSNFHDTTEAAKTIWNLVNADEVNRKTWLDIYEKEFIPRAQSLGIQLPKSSSFDLEFNSDMSKYWLQPALVATSERINDLLKLL